MSRPRKLKVGILATPDTSASTLFGFYDVLNTVGLGWEAFVSREESSPRFDVQIVAENDQPVQCGPAKITPTMTFADSLNLDIVIVASFAIPGLVLRNHSEIEFEWLHRVNSEGSVIGAFCTASSILAAAELLNGYDATTYWAYKDVVKLHYPRVNWQTEKNLCVTGENGNLVTSGGATGWEELALYLVTRF